MGFFLEVKGIVQGVGFRPSVYKTAKKLGFSGFVKNSDSGVVIYLDTDIENKDIFLETLKVILSPFARIVSINIKISSSDKKYSDFYIENSDNTVSDGLLISPDLCICDSCREELLNRYDRRYRYPFINCTFCGPRYSIIDKMPYDRKNTVMDEFILCEDCKKEYENPSDRRFHAQPNACSLCGPFISFFPEEKKDPLNSAINYIKSGNIIAIKGIGGFHLACDAQNQKTVDSLRIKKNRGRKPFAIMFKNIQLIKEFFFVSEKEEELLKSVCSPIVLLRIKNYKSWMENCAPQLNKIGVFLPYTPIHILMTNELPFFVLTSANRGSEPIIYEDKKIFSEKNKLFDGILTHNRKILNPSDDPVFYCFMNESVCIRPGRGSEPYCYQIEEIKNSFIAFGGDIKNTIAFSRNGEIHTLPYGGDLSLSECYDRQKNNVNFYKTVLDFDPVYGVCDKHPEYYSSKLTEEFFEKSKIIKIQHHYAHLLSLAVEQWDLFKKDQNYVGFAFDGTGYGIDNTVWGGEFMLFNIKEYKRIGSLLPFFLPGGDLCSKYVYRIGLILIKMVFKSDSEEIIDELLKCGGFKGVLEGDINFFKKNTINDLPGIFTSSMGRLFDGISSILGVCSESTYEGEAAILLECCSDIVEECYEVNITNEDNFILWDYRNMIKEIVQDKISGISVKIIGGKFHRTIAKMVYEVTLIAKKEHEFLGVGFSGGCFANELLLSNCINHFSDSDMLVLWNKKIPSNDSGIACGQIIGCNNKLKYY